MLEVSEVFDDKLGKLAVCCSRESLCPRGVLHDNIFLYKTNEAAASLPSRQFCEDVRFIRGPGLFVSRGLPPVISMQFYIRIRKLAAWLSLGLFLSYLFLSFSHINGPALALKIFPCNVPTKLTKLTQPRFDWERVVRGGGGGGLSLEFLVGVCSSVRQDPA